MKHHRSSLARSDPSPVDAVEAFSSLRRAFQKPISRILMPTSHVPRVLAIFATGLFCAASGWVMHGTAKHDASGSAVSPETLGSHRRTAEDFSSSPHDSTPPSRMNRHAAATHGHGGGDRIADTMDRVFTTDANDLAEMMEGFGALTSMTDAEILTAWDQLSRRVPSNNFSGGLTVMYLWSRLQQMGEPRELPAGWGVKDFEVALASEMSRHEGEHGRENILKRLQSGEKVSDTERRVVFGQIVKTEPLEAVRLWCSVTQPGDFQRDAPWLFTALSEPGSRDAIMTELRKWQTGGDLAAVVASLATNWTDRDPQAVQRWLQEPAQADIKETMMKNLIDARALANPVETWEWSKTLPDEQRRQALKNSAVQFASAGPRETEMGITAISKLEDPQDRLETIAVFGEVLSNYDIDRWDAWRNTLPPKEQDAANEAAFPAWVASDVHQAGQWLGTRPPGDATDRMTGIVASFIAQKDPDTAMKWLRSIPDPTRRREAASIALQNLGTDDLSRVRTLLNGLN